MNNLNIIHLVKADGVKQRAARGAWKIPLEHLSLEASLEGRLWNKKSYFHEVED